MNNPNQPSWPWSCPRAQLRLSQQATSSIQVTLPTSRTQWLQLGMGGMGERAYSILHFKNKHHPSFREGPREKKNQGTTFKHKRWSNEQEADAKKVASQQLVGEGHSWLPV